MSPSIPPFRVFTGERVAEVLNRNPAALIPIDEEAYRAHHRGRSVNPDSHFLPFPEAPANRIIALPAHYCPDDGSQVVGIKWIASFPGNIDHGLPRASAVLILNDPATGYPIACMEAGLISAARTAASAVSACMRLRPAGRGAASVAIIGTGLISRHVVAMMRSAGYPVAQIRLFDLNAGYANAFAERLRQSNWPSVGVADSIEEAVRASEVVVFATTAGTPHVSEPGWFAHRPLVLHLSLRDLHPAVILGAHNIVDDVDHAVKARTSLHLTQQQVGHREFVTATLAEILCGHKAPPAQDRPIVFSPFGMGILDLAVGRLVHAALVGTTDPVDNFFSETERI